MAEPISFQWDEGNREKSLIKHGISVEECEEAFLDPDKLTAPTLLNPIGEERRMLFGKTKQGKLLTIVFTIRASQIRVISARRASKKERKLYQNYHEQKT